MVKTKSSDLNLRSGPSTDHEIITTIPNGAPVTIIDENEAGDWVKINYSGTVGWCSAKYLNIV